MIRLSLWTKVHSLFPWRICPHLIVKRSNPPQVSQQGSPILASRILVSRKLDPGLWFLRSLVWLILWNYRGTLSLTLPFTTASRHSPRHLLNTRRQASSHSIDVKKRRSVQKPKRAMLDSSLLPLNTVIRMFKKPWMYCSLRNTLLPQRRLGITSRGLKANHWKHPMMQRTQAFRQTHPGVLSLRLRTSLSINSLLPTEKRWLLCRRSRSLSLLMRTMPC